MPFPPTFLFSQSILTAEVNSSLGKNYSIPLVKEIQTGMARTVATEMGKEGIDASYNSIYCIHILGYNYCISSICKVYLLPYQGLQKSHPLILLVLKFTIPFSTLGLESVLYDLKIYEKTSYLPNPPNDTGTE